MAQITKDDLIRGHLNIINDFSQQAKLAYRYNQDKMTTLVNVMSVKASVEHLIDLLKEK